MRVLWLDVGDRRIGVALSDALGMTAGRLTTIERRGMAEDLVVVRDLVTAHHVEVVVVGLPLTLRGERGIQAKRVTAFGDALRRRLSIPVRFVDERLTTVQGTRALLETNTSRRKRQQVVDQVAAQLILQQFLELRRQGDAGS